MNARLRFERRYCVESVFDSIPLVRYGKDMRVVYNVERIARLVRAHSIADGEVVIRVNTGSQCGDGNQDSFRANAHLADPFTNRAFQSRNEYKGSVLPGPCTSQSGDSLVSAGKFVCPPKERAAYESNPQRYWVFFFLILIRNHELNTEALPGHSRLGRASRSLEWTAAIPAADFCSLIELR